MWKILRCWNKGNARPRSSRQPSSKSPIADCRSSLIQSCFREPRETVLEYDTAVSSSASRSSVERLFGGCNEGRKGAGDEVEDDDGSGDSLSLRNSGRICASCECVREA